MLFINRATGNSKCGYRYNKAGQGQKPHVVAMQEKALALTTALLATESMKDIIYKKRTMSYESVTQLSHI